MKKNKMKEKFMKIMVVRKNRTGQVLSLGKDHVELVWMALQSAKQISQIIVSMLAC